MNMRLSDLLVRSEELSTKLRAVVALPPYDGTDRLRVSRVACSMAMEHWDATRALLGGGVLPSALVVHRAQYEALVRSVWVMYAASEYQVQKLTLELTSASEGAAKSVPQLFEMMAAVSSRAPREAFAALDRFKRNSWTALNSYAHAGLHPLKRHEDGYPTALMDSAVRNSNGLDVVTAMQAAALSGHQVMMKQVLAWAREHEACLPPPDENRAAPPT